MEKKVNNDKMYPMDDNFVIVVNLDKNLHTFSTNLNFLPKYLLHHWFLDLEYLFEYKYKLLIINKSNAKK